LQSFILLKINKLMKKIVALFTATVFAGLVACGPSAAEKEQKQREQDSLVQDSLMKIASEAATPPPADPSTLNADSTQH
jgi:hypothetical protein